MSLTFKVSSDSTFALASGQDLGNARVRLGDVGVGERAETGSPNFSGIIFDDPAGTLNIPALRPFWIDESTANPTRIFTGYIADRKYVRAPDRSSIVSAARQIDTTLVDLNTIFKIRTFHNSGSANRPKETIGARLTWLLTAFSGVVDAGQVNYITGRVMGPTDYRGMYPSDVLDDLVGATDANYFAYWDAAGTQVALYFQLNSYTGFASTLRLTNHASDVDNVTTFPAAFEILKDPSAVYSGVDYWYKGGRIYQTNATTQATFGARDTNIQTGAGPSRAVAIARAQSFLTAHSDETARITATALIPAAYVNLAINGQYITVKGDDLPNFQSYTTIRIVSRHVSQQTPDGNYVVTFELFTPRVGTGGPAAQNIIQAPFQKDCAGVIQSAHGSDDIGTNYTPTLPSAPTAGNTLVAFIFIKSNAGPTAPDVAAITTGSWTKGPTANGYDAAQYGGPGAASRISCYYRTVLAGDPSAYTVAPNAGNLTGTVIYEITGVSGAPTTFTGSDTVTAGNANVVGPIAGSGFMIGGFVLQRTNYAPRDSVAIGNGGALLWNDDPHGIGTGAECPWVFLGTKNGTTSVSFTGTVAANPNLNLWGRGTAAILFTSTNDCNAPEPGQPIPPEAAGTGTGASSQTFTTNYPYQPGSLLVTVNGVRVIPYETDPTTGQFTLSPAPPVGAAVVVSYQAADQTPTSATNASAGATTSYASSGQIGPPGALGDDGDDGPPGPPGARGATGSTGTQGPAGPPTIGPMGIDGIDGDDGSPGPPGAPGVQGPTGQAGNIGMPGMAGDDGDDGQIGAPGPAGAAGQTGPAGPRSIGPMGIDGDDGDTGQPGPPGLAGPTGPQGVIGPLGFGMRGMDGDDGDDGARGMPGPTGATGQTGQTGAGIQGPPGLDGDDGDPGYLIGRSDISNVDIQAFTANGTWNKPTWARVVKVVMWGQGGGGGGGASQTGAVARTGGGGGGGGAYAEKIFRASNLGTTETITVGTASNKGAGGASGGNGVAGTAGAQTKFGATPWLSAFGGGGGGPGQNSATLVGGGGGGGTAGAGTNGAAAANGIGGIPGTAGGTGTAIGGNGAVGGTPGGLAEYGGGGGGASSGGGGGNAGGSALLGCGAGGSGGGSTAAPAVASPGAGGASNSYVAGGGGAAGTSGVSPTVGSPGANSTVFGGAGGGGGGSTVTANTAGAVGGNGGTPGGGGGGGGTGTNTGLGGNGGDGGRGEVRVYSW